MLSTHPNTRLRRRLAAGLLGIGAATALLVIPAEAAPQDVSAVISGSLTTSASTFDLAGGVFSGSYDPDTGELTGGFAFEPTTVTVTTPIPATVSVLLAQPTPGSGQVDLVANTVTYTGELQLLLLNIDAPSIGSGSVEPCRYSLPLNLTGTIDPVSGVITMGQDSEPFGAILDDPRCVWAPIGSSISGVTDETVVAGGFANVMDVTFDVGDTTGTPPTTTTTLAPPTTTTTAPAAPPAVAAGGSPNFTG